MPEVFEVVAADDDRTTVPFRIPRRGAEPFEFSIPRMQYLDEPTSRALKERLRDVDRHVPQIDVNDQPIWRLDAKGETLVDDDGEKVPLLGPPQRTTLERTREVALTMLGAVVGEGPVLEVLRTLTVGELDQILGHWTKVSESPLDGLKLGESSASSTS